MPLSSHKALIKSRQILQRIFDSYYAYDQSKSGAENAAALVCPIHRCERQFGDFESLVKHVKIAHKMLKYLRLDYGGENGEEKQGKKDLYGCLGDSYFGDLVESNSSNSKNNKCEEESDDDEGDEYVEQSEGVPKVKSEYTVQLPCGTKKNLPTNLKIGFKKEVIDFAVNKNGKSVSSESLATIKNAGPTNNNNKGNIGFTEWPDDGSAARDLFEKWNELKDLKSCPNEMDLSWFQTQSENSDNPTNFGLHDFISTIDSFENSYREFLIRNSNFTPSIAPKKAWCSICLEEQSTTNNQMLQCAVCKVNVHQECYGVTYFCNGSWLCQKCLVTPTKNPKCELCPKLGGVYKQTTDFKWCHVNCALWIPECGFSRPIYLEPIDFLDDIPESRYKFTCTVCKIKSNGACIQCYKNGCFEAFHVTCALSEGYNLKIQIVSEHKPGGKVSYSVKKEVFCNLHSKLIPPSNNPHSKFYQQKNDMNGYSDVYRQLSIKSFNDFENPNKLPEKELNKILNYWKIKKFFQNALILPTLIEKNHIKPLKSVKIKSFSKSNSRNSVKSDLKSVASLLIERENEKQKFQSLLKNNFDELFKPTMTLVKDLIEVVQHIDIDNIFAQPVDVNIVTNYLSIIQKPMDMSKIISKIGALEYKSIDEIIADIDLMLENCLTYNLPKNFFHNFGLKMKNILNLYYFYFKKQYENSIYKYFEFVDQNLAVKMPKQTTQKRKRTSSIIELIDHKRPKTEKIKMYHFYWCKVRGFNWYPAITLEQNVKKYLHFNDLISKQSDEITSIKPNSGENYLIAYIEKMFPMQWATPENMVAMFVDEDTDKTFLKGKYLHAHNYPQLTKAFKKAKEMYDTIQKNKNK